ncbi:hypothetical protein D3C79_924180 [compost metagenome]
MEAAEAADLGQELAEAVAEIHQAGARCAVDQPIDQLHQHQAAEQQFGQLPDHQEHQHPQYAQDDRFALGLVGRFVHVLLLLS